MDHVRFDAPKKSDKFFQRKDPWGQGFSLWIVALILFLAPLAVSSLRHVRLDNDVENWLPDHDASAQEYVWCREHFPEEETVILTWEGSTIEDVRIPVLTGMLNGKVDEDGILRGRSPYVASVVHAGDLVGRMVDLGVDQDEAIRRVQGSLVGLGRIKVRLTDDGREHVTETQQGLIKSAKSIFGIDLRIDDAISKWAPSESQRAEFAHLTEAFAAPLSVELAPTELGVHDFQISWSGMSSDDEFRLAVMDWVRNYQGAENQKLVSACYLVPGSPVAVIVSLSEAGRADRTSAIASIRDTALSAMIPSDTLVVGGRVVAGAELNNGVVRAAWNKAEANPLKKSVILLSGLVGVIIALFSLKSIRLGLVVIFVSYYSALLGMSLVPLSGGSMNMVLIVMPTLLMVLALSGAIHVANYWKHAVWENPTTAVADATKMASQPCLMAAFTTSLGLISLVYSDLLPVRQFGIYASIGTMISVAMVLYGLPALLQMMPLVRVKPEEVNPKNWVVFGNLICRRWKLIGFCTFAVSIACGWGLKNFQVETKIIRYFPESSPVVKDYELVEDTLAGISPVEIIVKFSKESQENYRFVERLEIVRQIEEEIRLHPEVSGTLSLASFQPQREIPADTAATREKLFFNRRSQIAEKRIKEERAAETASFITMNRAPEQAGEELWRINAQAAVLTDANYNLLTAQLAERVASVTNGRDGISYAVTGTVPLFLRTQHAVLESLIWSSLMAFGMIAAVMIWVLKAPLAGLISMIPNVLPVIAIFGLVSWFGQKIDIGTMVTASVAMGIAVDGTLHLLTWFRNGLERGMTRQEAVKNALTHCGPAMWQTSAAVGVGLLVLFPAELLLISRFGWLMAALIAAAFIGDIVLLSSMLVGPLGALLERKYRKNLEKQASAVEPQASPSLPVPPHHLPLLSPETHETRNVG